MMFGATIDDVIKYGHTARRACWHLDEFIGFRLPDDRSDLTGAYFFHSCMHFNEQITVPWSPGTFDMTAHDWVIIHDKAD